MKKMKPLMWAMVLTGLASQAVAQPLALELKGLVERHPLILSGQKTVQAAEKTQDAARAGYYPRVDFTVDGGRESIDSRSYLGTSIGGDSVPGPDVRSNMNRVRGGLTVTQNLYAGNRTQNTVAIAQADTDLRGAELGGTVQNTVYDGLVAYLQIARLKTLLAVSERNERTTQRQMDLENERMQRGGGIAVDVLQARTRLQIARERKVFINQGMRDAVATYQQVFGHAPDLDSIEDVAIIDVALPADLDKAVELAMNNNPDIKQSKLQSRKAGKQVGLEKSGYFPTVDLVGYYGNDNNTNQLNRRREASALLRVNWNIFSGNETRSRSEAAMRSFEAVVDREVAVERKVHENVQTAWNQLQNGRERQDLLQNAAKIASEVMAFRKRLRDAGKETAINVLDAEVEYYSVLSNMINAEYDSKIAFYRLLAATGQLTPERLGIGENRFAVPTRPLAQSLAARNITQDSEPAVAVPEQAAPAQPAVPAAAPVQPAARTVPVRK
jgi:adhesin transport system outer membrane protein